MDSEDSWVGLQVNNHLIAEELASGQYSNVYQGHNHQDNETHIFKVAKQKKSAHTQSFENPFATRALSIMERGLVPVRPDTNFLIRTQFARMKERRETNWPEVQTQFERDELCAYTMEPIAGATLRQKMSEVPISLESLLSLSESLESLDDSIDQYFHGDLKPENILCDGALLRPIDPGYFGAGECIESNDLNLAITTPAYYPFLKPDDLFAFGLLIWEIALEYHPLVSIRGGAESSNIDQSVRDWVDSYEKAGQYFLSSIVDIERPSAVTAEISEALEDILLKGLRLKVSSKGTIEVARGFENFKQWTAAFRELKNAGTIFLTPLCLDATP